MPSTIEIPGGTAELFDPKELTPARRIPILAFRHRYRDLFDEVATAARVESPTGDVEVNHELTGPTKRLTQEEAEALQHYQYTITWGWLKSWTIPHPFPASWEDLLNTPTHIVDALTVAVITHGTKEVSDDMEMSAKTLADKESFTGSSAASKTSSKATAKRRSSARKPSNS